MSKINFLPPWVETNLQPAFYDLESGTVLQQTARMYAKVNQLVRTANEQNETIADFVQQFTDLHDYVYDYFDNLDVQEEVNTKLDIMSQDGTLGNLLNDYMKPYIDEKIDDVSENINNLYDILSQVEDLSPKGAYVTTTALISADPATGVYVITGDGHIYAWIHGGDTPTDLGAYQTAVNNETVDILNEKDWVNVKLDLNGYRFHPDMERKVIQVDGAEVSSTTRLTSVEKYRLDSVDDINADFGYNVATFAYDKDGTALGYYPHNESGTSPFYVQVVKPSQIYNEYPTTDNFKIMMKKTNGSEEMPLTDATKLSVILNNKLNNYYYGKSLSNEYVCCDNYTNGVFMNNGSYSSNNARLASNEYLKLPEYFNNIEAVTGYEFGIACWDAATRAWIGYVTNSAGDTQVSGYYMTSLKVNELPADRIYRIVIRNADTTSTMNPLTDYDKARMYFKDGGGLKENISIEDSGVVIQDGSNASNAIWTDYDGRLAFGMNTSTALVPTINKQQMINYGTLITMKNGGNNRWGFHAIECYDNTNYNRITLLTDKHTEYGNKLAEFYYYVGDDHSNASYGYMRLGSDVRNHSFLFNRDEMIADGAINAHSVIQLARINPLTDIITTYENYAQADSAYDPENASTSANNAKCCRYIQLKNAENGAMFYDTNRNKLVCKVNGQWSDVNVTPVPDGTYPF